MFIYLLWWCAPSILLLHLFLQDMIDNLFVCLFVLFFHLFKDDIMMTDECHDDEQGKTTDAAKELLCLFVCLAVHLSFFVPFAIVFVFFCSICF